MNNEFDFFYDDFLVDSLDRCSPMLCSEPTDIFLENIISPDEGIISHFRSDFNPDDFLNDVQSEPSLFTEKQPFLNDKGQINFSNLNFNTRQSLDSFYSSNNSPQSSIESETNVSSPTIVALPESLDETADKHTTVTAIPQENISVWNKKVDETENALIFNQPESILGKEHISLLNLCAMTTNSAQTNIVLPKIVANNCKPNLITAANGIILNEKVLRKHQRMIRNRESASLSRKKKRDYVNSLEAKITTLESENIQLKCEMATLKNQLTNLRQTCTCNSRTFLSNQKSIGSHIKKNTAVLLAMVFMVSLNFGKFHSFFAPELSFERHRLVASNSNSSRNSIRKLLWVNDSISTDDDILFGPHENRNGSLKRNYINQTENLRLTSELRKLAGVRKNLRSVLPKEDYDHRKYYALKSTNHLNMLKDQVFNPEKNKYSRLFQKLHRKNDTFYIFSFNNENILLPAALYNESSRPKMSLMLPTSGFMTNRKIAFMQIDCEVLNTSTIQLKESFVPPTFRNHIKSNRSVESKTNKDKHKLNPYGFSWKDYNKKNVFKTQVYGRNIDQDNKNAGDVPDIPSIYSIF